MALLMESIERTQMRWQQARSVRKARELVAIARSLSTQPGRSRNDERVARLLRRAWRTLLSARQAQNPAPVPPTGGIPSPGEQVDTLLAEFGVRARIARLIDRLGGGRRLAGVVLVATVSASILIAAVPPLRHLFFPPDLAAGKPWRASSTHPEFSPTGTVVDDRSKSAMFHTAEEASPALVIDLGGTMTIRKVRVKNRLDCCPERAVPLAVEVSGDGAERWRLVAYRRLDFTTWTATFPATAARKVRLRVDRQSMLHLQTVSIY